MSSQEKSIAISRLTLTALKVIQENVETLALDTVLLDNDASAANDLSGVALTVELAETSPCPEDLGISDLDQVDFVLSAESLDKLEVFGLSAGLYENAEMGLALVESLGAFAEATGETVVNESVLQNLLLALYGFRSLLPHFIGQKSSPEERPQRTSSPWEPQRSPQRVRFRLECHLQRQTSYFQSIPACFDTDNELT